MLQIYDVSDNRYSSMEFSRCGLSGLMLPRLSFGFWHNFGDKASYDNMKSLCYTAFNNGITHFDLANNYGPAPGSAEEHLGMILKEDLGYYRDELIISTKAGYEMWSGPYGNWGSRKSLIASIDQSLKRMNLEYVDIFYHHRMDPETPLEETMGALAQIVSSGKALYVGLSNYDGPTLEKAAAILSDLKCPFIINQNRYSIFDRTIEDNGLKEASKALGKGLITFSPLAQGLLTDRYLNGIPDDSRMRTDGRFLSSDKLTPDVLNKIRQLNSLALERGQSLAQMALSWILRDDAVTSALIGASRPEQILDNLKALQNLSFSQDELDRIDRICSGETENLPFSSAPAFDFANSMPAENIFQQNDFQQNDFRQNDFQQSSFQQNDFQQNDFQQNDFQQNDFRQNDFQQNDFQQNDFRQNDFQQNDFQQNDFMQNDFMRNGSQQEVVDPIKSGAFNYPGEDFLPPSQEEEHMDSSYETSQAMAEDIIHCPQCKKALPAGSSFLFCPYCNSALVESGTNDVPSFLQNDISLPNPGAEENPFDHRSYPDNSSFGNQDYQGYQDNNSFGNQDYQGYQDNNSFGNQGYQGYPDNNSFANQGYQGYQDNNSFGNQGYQDNASFANLGYQDNSFSGNQGYQGYQNNGSFGNQGYQDAFSGMPQQNDPSFYGQNMYGNSGYNANGGMNYPPFGSDNGYGNNNMGGYPEQPAPSKKKKGFGLFKKK